METECTPVTSAAITVANPALVTAIAVMTLIVAAVTVGPMVLPYQTAVIDSGSMEPSVRTGELVFLREVSADRLRVGDVITFEKPGDPDTLVTHRVVGIEEGDGGGSLVTRGDANPVPDSWRLRQTGKYWTYVTGVPVAAAMSMPACGARAWPLKTRRRPNDDERGPLVGWSSRSVAGSRAALNRSSTCVR